MRDLRTSSNAPVPPRRRDPLTPSEAAYFVNRLGRRSFQALSAITGTSQSSVRRAVPLAEQGVAADPLDTPRPRRRRGPDARSAIRVASLSLAEAAAEVGLNQEALFQWLVGARWIRRGRCGTAIAGASKQTAGLLNQPVQKVAAAHRERLVYGEIRFTPRGLVKLRAQLAPAEA